jgi:hypothetical protein
MELRHSLTATLFAAAASASQAAVIFSDNFDANALGLNAVPSGWSVASGTVDIVGTGFFDLVPGNGFYIDLDGSTGDAGVLSRSFTLTGGQAYTANFTLAGSRRGDSNVVNVAFGSASSALTFASAAGPSSFSLSFTPASNGAFSLSFSNLGGDNLGALLFDVSVSTPDGPVPNIPEPQTYALMLAGLAAVGIAARKRRHNA